MNIFLSTTLLVAQLTNANPAFFCQSKTEPELKRYGDLQFYESCADKCDCSFI